MVRRAHMLESPYILRCLHFRRIHRTRQNEAPLRQPCRGSEEQLLQSLLPIGGVRSHVAEVTAILFGNRHAEMDLRIHAAIESRHITRAECSKLLERAASGEREHQPEPCQLVSADVLNRFIAPQAFERDWR